MTTVLDGRTRLQLAALAASSAALGAALVLSVQGLRRANKRARLREALLEAELDEDDVDVLPDLLGKPSLGRRKSSAQSVASSRRRKDGTPSKAIINEALARNIAFFGDEGQQRVRDSFVIVVGLGGVGAAAATMLVRSGVRKIRLIDFDMVSLSSLNRHATATLAQVGTPKVSSCAEYFKQVAPWVEVDARVELFSKEAADELLAGNPDYVLDAIDNINTKVDLLAYCHRHKIKVFASLGAGSKADPSRIQVADISSTQEDPLARSVRRLLRIEGISHGIPVVYSTEKPRKDTALLPLPQEEFEKGKVDELSAIANFRVRILPVLGPLPAMFGNAAAAYILDELAGLSIEPLALRHRPKVLEKIWRKLGEVDMKLGGGQVRPPISVDDVAYVLEEIHHGRSVVPPHTVSNSLVVLKWKRSAGYALDNLVVFTEEEGNSHIEHCLVGGEDPAAYWGPAVVDLLRKRQENERRLRHLRIE